MIVCCFCRKIWRELFLDLQTVLDSYQKGLGKKVNIQKSFVFFNKGLGEGRCIELKQMFEMEVSNGRGKYLGLPCLVSRSQKGIFSYLKDRMWNKNSG